MVQAITLGFVIGEVWYFSMEIGYPLNKYINNSYIQNASDHCFVFNVSLLTAVLVCIYFFLRGGFYNVKKLFESKRLDLAVLVILGLCVSLAVGGVGTIKYKEYVAKIDVLQLFIVVAIPVVIALMLVLRGLAIFFSNINKSSSDSFFINDKAIEKINDDTLNLSNSATRFAELVLNRGSSDSLVFGIDAPWGSGKSSYIYFCCEHWSNKSDPKPIILRFEPLRYKENEDLVDKLVNAIIDAVQKEAFQPSVNSLFLRYLRQIKGKKGMSLLGVQIEFESNSGSEEETFKTLEACLSEFKRKIIIIIDDLDRLSWNEVKNILFAVKRSFMLPNVSFVLCYDTEKLTLLENQPSADIDIVKDFLEKFVNVKISIFLDSKVLAEYVKTDIKNAINNNLQLDPLLLDQVKPALDALVNIYDSNDYVFYQDFLGDIRKIKRLINTMMLFEIPQTDYENSDFNKHDLLHLLLIYINYPNIFRKIYNAETNGKSGFFSLVTHQNLTDPGFTNSQNYNDYIESGLSDSQKFLLNRIFKYDTLIQNLNHDQSLGDANLDANSRACFNDKSRDFSNLERYLRLIVNLTKQNKVDSYQFYLNKKKELFSGKSISHILDSKEFSFKKGDFSRDQLWNIIANSAYEMSPEIGFDVISYLLKNLNDYSFLERVNIGANSRINLVYSLLKLLDQAGWGRKVNGRRNNTDENVLEIAEWIFGEGEFLKIGILKVLSDPNRGALGLFDMLLFRLYCSADRRGSTYNLHRAVSLHCDMNAPTSGPVNEIARLGMREISQKVFNIFSDQYIQAEKNIFEEIENLSLEDFAGKTTAFVRKQLSDGVITNDELNVLISTSKTKVIAFITYQLGNSMISSGVGCGYYDIAGDHDNHEIRSVFNDYLFEVCFNPDLSERNYEFFLDYLLINFSVNYWQDDVNRYSGNLAEFTKVLDKERLRSYWAKNRGIIISLNFLEKEKFISTANYSITYKEGLKNVFDVLDQLLSIDQ